ncbi:putative heterokaryon incompatibility protein [Rosellinia necatrix]|uniref:Putative heterokaryon incompatibility protein n=1 Tax=Rosellinia necatrix TaxID=77044 RepID=A0A1W2TFI7_ROSNE|nr:putative heterokaryon incompatibility protein [Rosellinia necatrix]
MASATNPHHLDEVDALGQVLAAVLTTQNSCAVHELCDSSCPERVGVRRYQLMPDGEKRGEVDERAQLTAASANTGPPARTEPLVIADSVPRFMHSPLARPESMIRLLKIKPGLLRADHVDCELVHFDIDDAPVYGALSYCWGPPPDDIKFLCNGKVFYGRESLERALKRLRAGFQHGRREEYIWADAICINQRDFMEKDAQIRLMERIYAGAANVYVDLGDIDGQKISMNGFTLQFSSSGGMGAQDTLTSSDDPEHPLHFKTAFLALSKPWFTRTWIIQEAALARTITYMFNGTVFTQQHLDSILSRDAMVAHPERQRELMSSNAIMRGYMNFQKLLRIKNHSGKMDSLELIQLTRDFAATNAEDKIFGLFALLSDADREAIGPYSQSKPEVYRRFAALQVRRGRTVAMLDSSGLQRRSPQDTSQGAGVPLPSWVPDWTAQGRSPKGVAGLRPVPYAASGGTQAAHVALIGDETGRNGLRVRCVAIDTVATVAHVHSAPLLPGSGGGGGGEPDFLVFHDAFRAGFDELVRRRGSVYADPEDAFARLLLMDDLYTGRNAIAYSTPITDPAGAYRGALAAWRERRAQGRAPGARMDAVQTYAMQAGAASVGRGFATTRNGYIGLVPPCAQVGDLIVVVLGATVPYVLRWAHTGYVLVGDAFIHGVMYGEALQRDNLLATDIILV